MKEAYDLGWHTTAKLGNGRLEQSGCTLTIRYTNINSQLQINTDSAWGGKKSNFKGGDTIKRCQTWFCTQKHADSKNPINSLIDLAGATRIFEKPLNMGILFDTLGVLGAHSGTPELCGLLIIAGLCAESQTKKTQAPPPIRNLCFATKHSPRRKCVII